MDVDDLIYDLQIKTVVTIPGPQNTPYEGGKFKVGVTFPRKEIQTMFKPKASNFILY